MGSIGSLLASRKPAERTTPPFEQLRVVAQLGNGAVGTVVLVQHDGQEYALKKMLKRTDCAGNIARQMQAERDIHASVDDPFISQFFGSYKDRLHLYILTEFGSGGDLWDLRDERSKVFSQDSPRGSSTMFYSACVTEALDLSTPAQHHPSGCESRKRDFGCSEICKAL